MQKSIAVTVTVRNALANTLTDPQRDLVERAGLLADTLDGHGWFVGDVTRRGFAPVSINALVPEGAAIWLTLEQGRARRDLIRRLWRYDVPLFVDATRAEAGAAPVAVVGVKMDKVRAAEDARAAIQAEAETRYRLACSAQVVAV